ncbi:MAG: hypothetical protein WC740_04690 [Verrucomicrobiia bacterium]
MKLPLHCAGTVIFWVVSLACTLPPIAHAHILPVLPAVAPGNAAAFSEKQWDQLSDKDLKDWGKLAIKNSKWRHGETEHFIIHYQKLSEAQRAARESEIYCEYLKTDLGLVKDYHKGKNHLFIYAKEEDWNSFCFETKRNRILVSTHYDGEMFILARSNDSTFSQQLAFPVTCAVLRRFFSKDPPHWVTTGVANFEEGNAYKQMKGIGGGDRGSGRRGSAAYPMESLLAANNSPRDSSQRYEYSRTCERLVRFLLTKLDRQRFVTLVTKLCERVSFQTAIPAVYPEKFKTYQEFLTAYNSFL